MSFWTSKNTRTQELEQLREELAALRERAELLDTSCGVGLWQALLHNADAFDPQSAWTWSPEFRRRHCIPPDEPSPWDGSTTAGASP